MPILYDKAFLLLYTLGICFLLRPDAGYVFFFLSSLCLTAVFYILEDRCPRVSLFLFFLYGLSALSFPWAALCLPVLTYDFTWNFIKKKSRFWLLAFPALLVLLHASRFSSFPVFYTELGILLSTLLCSKTSGYLTLSERFKQTRDDSVERSLLLQEKNQSLLEKQNYEIYAATLKERNRIAREIHDNVGHMLSRSILMLGALKTIAKDPVLAAPLTQLEATLHTAMNNIRESVHDLHDESLNLKDSAGSITESFQFCPVSLEYDMGDRIPSPVKYCFLSILKEALSNTARHSLASHIWVTMREHPAIYQLVIRDNGRGGQPAFSEGIGLSNMQERVSHLKGSIHFQTENGFQIFISIPKSDSQNLSV